MAHMNQEKKSKLAPKIKAVLAKYGIKGTLSVNQHSTLVLTIKKGSIDFISNYNETVGTRPGGFRTGSPATDYLNVNPYWFHEHFTGKAKNFLHDVLDAMKGPEWYDNSDIQSDYFDIAYYVDVNIGKWNKPYQLTA